MTGLTTIGNSSATTNIKGNLQVDGSVITVNSTQVTIVDPIITLGIETAQSS